jgi:signal transduction histidine kinase
VTSPGSAIFSLQTKLIVAFCLVVLVALTLAGSVFVYVRRGDQEEQELDRVIAASPAIHGVFSVLLERQTTPQVLAEFVEEAATGFDVRILLVDRTSGVVQVDSGDSLTGEQIVLPQEITVRQGGRPRPYISWEPEAGTPGSDLILVSAQTAGQFGQFAGRNDQLSLLLAVPQATITGAWHGLLPALGVAAAIALPVAALLAILVARYITRPLQELTVASQRMAEGSFDVQVSVDRSDEVGRLAQAFSSMSRRVGDAHTQMRQLVANVSHDLKTPLTSILGFSQALRDGRTEEADEARRLGGVIYDEATRLSSRLNDLLYLSELESGQTLLQRDEIDLRRLVQEAVSRIAPQVAAREVRLAVDLTEGVTLSADGAKLERALENVLDNARKYTPSGGEIRVRSYVESGAPGHICIEVASTSVDISEKELPRLFERFYRREGARNREGGSAGSGLGLPIARDLVELHGGTLTPSLSDGMLAFTMRLPLGRQDG